MRGTGATWSRALALSFAAGAALALAQAPATPTAPAAGPLQFRAEQVASDFGVGYAVAIGDLNGDKRDDVVAISGTDLVVFEAPKFGKRVLLSGATPKDNVCLALHDIDRDGRMDVALGATWQPTNTTSGGSLHWARHPATPDGTWEVYPIAEEPTLHRMRWADVDGDGTLELVVVPLHGRGTKGPDWLGQGARILVFRPPANPQRDSWPVEVADDSLHIVHNLLPVNFDKDRPEELLMASREGVTLLDRDSAGKWSRTLVGEGAPGEIKIGRVGGRRMLATVEPWHGTSIVVYAEGPGTWARTAIETAISGGHALGWGDFDGDGSDELAAGWRDAKPSPGLAVYGISRDGATTWKQVIDDGGMATEDLAVADLDADGRPDIVASGRATRNVKIYWNETKVKK
jgi:hypothetical protein